MSNSPEFDYTSAYSIQAKIIHTVKTYGTMTPGQSGAVNPTTIKSVRWYDMDPQSRNRMPVYSPDEIVYECGILEVKTGDGKTIEASFAFDHTTCKIELTDIAESEAGSQVSGSAELTKGDDEAKVKD